MAKFDIYADKINIDNDNLIFTHENEKFLNLFYGNLYKKSKILNDFKKRIRFYKSFVINEDKNDFKTIQKISGIYKKEDDLNKLQSYVEKLPKYSFAIWFKFELEAPYFSKDDDEFYIIQNPILKETNFKVPMVRGSGWKGALASAFRELFKEDFESNKDKIESFLRIFGAGSDSIKALENYILGKSKDLEGIKNKLLEFMLFELGIKVNKDLINEVNNAKDKNELFKILKDKISSKLTEKQKEFPLEFQTHKGRAIFYPTYFDKLSLEIINPHDRRKRAGTNPIHYEVVPKETEGIFQLIYIPFDGVLKSDEDLKKEVSQDLNNLCEAIEKLSEQGIGAKTKLGWGRFSIETKKVCVNGELELPEGWEKC
ncbi:RAMP superfamily CRISPR-associated protein [Deferribacter thermophilus]|uniref:RAMP superfamily CRISPR-associated protein n=1 Tax=Deferribacter thermophilus TaxID=53573 RepID=UPI003C14A8ED